MYRVTSHPCNSCRYSFFLISAKLTWKTVQSQLLIKNCKPFGLFVFLLLWIITPFVCFSIEVLIFCLPVCKSFARMDINICLLIEAPNTFPSLTFRWVYVVWSCTKFCFVWSQIYQFLQIFSCWVDLPSRSYSEPEEISLPPFDPFLHLKWQEGEEKLTQLSLKHRKMNGVTNAKTFYTSLLYLIRSHIRALQKHTQTPFYFTLSNHSPSAYITKAEPSVLICHRQSPFPSRISDIASFKDPLLYSHSSSVL